MAVPSSAGPSASSSGRSQSRTRAHRASRRRQGRVCPRIQGLEALDAEVPTYKRPRAPLGFRAMGLGPRIKGLEFEV